MLTFEQRFLHFCISYLGVRDRFWQRLAQIPSSLVSFCRVLRALSDGVRIISIGPELEAGDRKYFFLILQEEDLDNQRSWRDPHKLKMVGSGYPYSHSKRDFPNWSGSFCSNSDQKSTTSCSHFFNKPKVPESVHSYIVLELHRSESCKNTVNLRALPA